MSVAKRRRFFIFAIVSLLLMGCSSTNRLYMETLRLAFLEDGPSLTLEEVQSSKIDFLKILHGERLPVYMALAFIEDGQHKWISSDHAILAMDNNKIIRITGLDVNLQYTDNLANNPLRMPANLADVDWHYHIDVAEHDYGLPVHSQWHRDAPQEVTFFNQALTVIPIIETVTVDIDKPYWTHETSWQNLYWLEQHSKQVIYSEQLATPYSDPMKMTFVSRIGRILKAREAN